MAGPVDSIQNALAKHGEGAVVMMEVPTDAYFDANVETLRYLTENGFEGIYISFQRPDSNVVEILGQKGIDLSKIVIIDAASSCAGAPDSPPCVPVSKEMEIDELVRAIYTSLEKLHGRKKFIFIDSLTTIALYKPLSEIMRFSQFLIGTVKRREVQDVFVVFNVARDLRQKPFIRDVALHVDEVVASPA